MLHLGGAKVLMVIQTADGIELWHWNPADQVTMDQHTVNEPSTHTRGGRTYRWPTTRKARFTVDGRAEGVRAQNIADAMRYAAEHWNDSDSRTPRDELPEVPRGLPAG